LLSGFRATLSIAAGTGAKLAAIVRLSSSGVAASTKRSGASEFARRTREVSIMATVEKSIDVDLPVRTVYNQWTQFEEFPRFMEGVEEVRQLNDSRLHWKAEIGGKTEEWDAVITDQVPDRIVAWRSTSGAENSGAIRFNSLGPDRTRVTAEIGYDPEGIVENIGDKLGVVSRRVEGDLERFKTFIEERGAASGAWRGEIHGGVEEGGSIAL
jgi:uncharacterized membrane protein